MCVSQQACKRAASSATYLINASAVAGKSNTNTASQSQLNAQCQVVSDQTIPKIVQALRAVAVLQPGSDQSAAQLTLVNAAHDILQVNILTCKLNKIRKYLYIQYRTMSCCPSQIIEQVMAVLYASPVM